jgi:hypothetical protein
MKPLKQQPSNSWLPKLNKEKHDEIKDWMDTDVAGACCGGAVFGLHLEHERASEDRNHHGASTHQTFAIPGKLDAEETEAPVTNLPEGAWWSVPGFPTATTLSCRGFSYRS